MKSLSKRVLTVISVRLHTDPKVPIFGTFNLHFHNLLWEVGNKLLHRSPTSTPSKSQFHPQSASTVKTIASNTMNTSHSKYRKFPNKGAPPIRAHPLFLDSSSPVRELSNGI